MEIERNAEFELPRVVASTKVEDGYVRVTLEDSEGVQTHVGLHEGGGNKYDSNLDLFKEFGELALRDNES